MDVNRDNLEVFSEIIRNFEQLNVERSAIVNNQGDAIADLA